MTRISRLHDANPRFFSFLRLLMHEATRSLFLIFYGRVGESGEYRSPPTGSQGFEIKLNFYIPAQIAFVQSLCEEA